MIIGSVCSGIGAPECAWHPLGWRSAFMSEIDAFPRAVLAHHYPEVPLHGDFTTIQAGDYGAIDLLVGGTPCQSFSVAGLRGGMADERGNLALEYLRLAERLRPRWLVWENVPGVLSSAGGRDFGAFVGGLAELGYGWAYRCLDAQHFGLAQRRLRVFVVAYLGDWRPAAAVLFEPASLRGDPAPGREAGERVARPIAAGSPRGSGYRNDADTADSLIAATSSGHGWWDQAEVGATLRAQDSITKADTLIARCLTGHSSRSDWETETFIAEVAGTLRAHHGNPQGQDAWCGNFVASALRARDMAKGVDSDCTDTLVPTHGDAHACPPEGDAAAVLRALRHAVGEEAFAEWGSGILDPLQRPEVLRSWLHGGRIRCAPGEARPQLGNCAPPCTKGVPAGLLRDLWLNGPDGRSPQGRQLAQQLALQFGAPVPLLPHSQPQAAVRRLTPREAERLMGFPDDYTLIPYRRAMAKDGPRYRALGNSMAVPVMRWIGHRIAAADAAVTLERAA